MFPFRTTQKQAPRVDLLMSPDGYTHPELHQAEEQRANQSSPAVFAQSRAGSQAAYYHHYHYHGEEHNAVPEDGMSGIESTYSFVSPSEAASSRTDGSEADSSVGSGKIFRFPKIKLSLTAPPPKPKPKPKKLPQTPKSAVSFGRGGAGNARRVASNKSPTTPSTAQSHKTFNSDPSVDDRLSTHTGRTGATLDYTLDYTSDSGTYTQSRLHASGRSSRWSFEPSRNQGATRRSSLDSALVDNGGFERHQYPTHFEGSTSTGLVGKRTIATTPPNISPEAGRLRQEEQRQPLRDPSGSVVQSSRPSSAGVPSEQGEFARTSPDPRIIRSSSPSGSDHQFSPTAPPPSYDEATDRLGRSLGPSNHLQFDGPHVGPHHATYDAPSHQGIYQGTRAFPTMPQRINGRTTHMESAYHGHTRPVEGHLPWLHQQSMEKSAVARAETSQYTTERSNCRLSPPQHTKISLYHQDPASSKPFHRLELHLEGGEQPSPHVLENENNIAPRESAVRYHQRSVTPTVDSTRDHTRGNEPSVPNRLDDIPTSSRAPAVTLDVPSSPLLLPFPLEMQAESEGSQETQPKQLSRVEKALLRRAVAGMKVDNPQV